MIGVLLMSWVSTAWADPAVAIARFANLSTDPQLQPLGRAMSEMLTTDLAAVEGVTLVERSRLSEVLAELNLNQTDAVDPDRAVEWGRLVGATHLVVGSLVESSPELRIDARVIEVAEGTVIATAEVHGDKSEFFLLEKELASRITAALEVELSAREQVDLIARIQTESLDATLAWARGLDALDRGEIELARKEIELSLAADGDFTAAAEFLESLSGKLDTLVDAQRDQVRAAQEGVDAELVALREAGDPMSLAARINELRAALAHLGLRKQLGAMDAILNAEIPDEWGNGQPGTRPTFTETALQGRIDILETLGRESDLLATAEAFTERYPDSVFLPSVQRSVKRARERLEARSVALAKIPSLEADVHVQVLRLQCADHPEPETRRERCEELVALGPVDAPWGTVVHAACADDDRRAVRALLAIASDPDHEVSQYEREKLSNCSSWLGPQMSLWAKEAVQERDLELYVDQPLSSASPSEVSAMIKRMLARWPDEQKAWRSAVGFSVIHNRLEDARGYYEGFNKRFPDLVDSHIHERMRHAERQAAQASDPSAFRMHEMAEALQRTPDLEQEEAAAWEALYRLAPDYREHTGSEALWSAAEAIREAHQRDWDLRRRELLEELLAVYPDSERADWARTALDRLPSE